MTASGGRVLFAGDTHGVTAHVDYLAATAVREGCERVFVVGDFGYWEHTDDGRAFLDKVHRIALRHGVQIAFCDGNHDNTALLRERHTDRDDDGLIVVRDRVRYAPRGHRWTWGSRRLLAAGGGASLDKQWRVEREEQLNNRELRRIWRRPPSAPPRQARDFTGTLWFPGEELTDAEVDTIVADTSPVDLLLTHDKPRGASPAYDRKDEPAAWPNQDRVQRIVDALNPPRLIHGHLHHRYTQQLANGTVVDGLSCDSVAGATVPRYRREQSWLVAEL